jgi:hypothetical protein
LLHYLLSGALIVTVNSIRQSKNKKILIPENGWGSMESISDDKSGIGAAQRKTLSRTFLALAWVIEIAAAAVGLTLALYRLGEGLGIDGILAALPFFAVAIMELTKIPIATVVYHTAAKRWRIGFTIALALSMVITFETFAIGFDQYQAQLEKRIKPTLDKIKELKLQIVSSNTNIAALDNISKNIGAIDTEYRGRTDAINNKYDSLVEALEKQKRSIEKKYEGNAIAINEQIKALRDQLKDKSNQIETERKTITNELNELRKNNQKEIEELQSEKQIVKNAAIEERSQIRNKAASDYKECEASHRGSFFGKDCSPIAEREKNELGASRTNEKGAIGSLDNQISRLRNLGTTLGSQDEEREGSIRGKHADRIKSLEIEKNNINEKIATKISELGRLSGKFSVSDKKAIAGLTNRININNKARKNELNEAKKIADQRRSQADLAKKDSIKTTRTSNDLRKKLVKPCADLNEKVSENQVYRLAVQFFGVDDACDLTQEQLTLTQWLWFGSLAMVTSALGTTLAFAGLVIRYPPSTPKREGRKGAVRGIFRRINYALALLHRRLRKPKIKEVTVEKEVIKEVVQEVPVDRVVEKTVEVTKEVPVEKVVYRDVPREIVKKELIHVPLFTQDPKAVTKSE